jgi:hypothetical protein
MCPSGATCLTTDCCYSVLALCKSNPSCWSRTKRTSSWFHWQLTCSRHEIAAKLMNWRYTTITHLMLYSSSTTQEDKTEIRKVIDSWLLFNTKNIDWCLTQMWTIIQLYRDKNKLYSSEWLLYNANSFKIGICYISAKHAALRRKSKDWLARNQNDVSEWSDMSHHGLLLQCASTMQIQPIMLV